MFGAIPPRLLPIVRAGDDVPFDGLSVRSLKQSNPLVDFMALRPWSTLAQTGKLKVVLSFTLRKIISASRLVTIFAGDRRGFLTHAVTTPNVRLTDRLESNR